MTATKTITTKELERLAGLTETRIRQIQRAGNLPASENGRWPYPATVQQLIRFYRQRNEGTALDAARLEKLQAEARLASLRLAEEEKRLVDVFQVAERLNMFIASAKSELWGWSDIDEERRREMLAKLKAIYGAAFAEQEPKENTDES